MERHHIRFTFIIFLIILTAFSCIKSVQEPNSIKIDTLLTSKINEVKKDFDGDVGIYVHHLKTGQSVEINADTLFPTASMIKVPIMLALFDKINKGELEYDQELTYRDSLLYAGSDILGSFKDGEKIQLSKVVMLMITMSDNTASLWSQDLAGTGIVINEWLDSKGYIKTRVNSRTPGRKGNWKIYGWGQTTPKEMSELLLMIREGKAISQAASEEMYKVLCNIYWNSDALSQIPPYVQAASKQGSVSKSRSEVVLVNAPSGDYVFSVITKNQKDTSWETDNAGYVLIRAVSKLLWNYFESNSTWKPSNENKIWSK